MKPLGPVPARSVDVVGIGETMAVLTPVADESLENADVCHLMVGGAESNVLMQLARTGLRTRFVSRVGGDPLGRRVVREIAAAGVDVSRVTTVATHPTGVYFKDRGPRPAPVSYHRCGSAASTLDLTALATAGIGDAHALYLTGITPCLSAAVAALVDRAFDDARTQETAVLFDVNHRPALWPAGGAGDALLDLARRADVVFVGLDEAVALWDTATPDDVRRLFAGWPGRLVVKDGAVGATEFHAGGVDFVAAVPVEVVEQVGAGDAFAAGYVAALLAGASCRERLRNGHRQAAAALRSVGDVPRADAS